MHGPGSRSIGSNSDIGDAAVTAERLISQTSVYQIGQAKRNEQHYREEHIEQARRELLDTAAPDEKNAILVKSENSLNCSRESVLPLFEENQVPVFVWFFLYEAVLLELAPAVTTAKHFLYRAFKVPNTPLFNKLDRPLDLVDMSVASSHASIKVTIVATNILAKANALLNPHGIVACIVTESVSRSPSIQKE